MVGTVSNSQVERAQISLGEELALPQDVPWKREKKIRVEMDQDISHKPHTVNG